jgi:hypothetical protein
MQLWTDYEGVTLDGAFPLKKLLMPEGRSAFFSTAGTKGEPTVVRLIECHFDEEEILSRWRCVEALSHPNFLKFERFGQTELDGRPVVYAVFEKVDANLAEVLDQGNLTIKDAAQLASSLVAALDVLHTHGFIHEHIEPRNIFAIGDVVKLRGDCIREAPEGEEGRTAKQRDVHRLSTVLLQALTQREAVEGLPDSALPPPFGQIIRNGLDGSWGLEDIRAALGRQFGLHQPPAPQPMHAAPATTPAAAHKASSAATQTPAAQPPTAQTPAAKPSPLPEAPLPLPLFKDRIAGSARATNGATNGATNPKAPWDRNDPQAHAQNFSLRSRFIGTGIAALLLLLFAWILVHAWGTHRHKATQPAAVSQPASVSQPPAPSASSVATSPTPAPVPTNPTLAARVGPRADWRVIAYTYNRQTDAENKVSTLARRHPELQPEVFTPTGHAPYLVSIGGVMDRDAAHALARRSRSLGLPRDMYAQNYSR